MRDAIPHDRAGMGAALSDEPRAGSGAIDADGYRALVAVMIEQAFAQARGSSTPIHGQSRLLMRVEARHWIESDRFVGAAALVGLDVEAARAVLRSDTEAFRADDDARYAEHVSARTRECARRAAEKVSAAVD